MCTVIAIVSAQPSFQAFRTSDSGEHSIVAAGKMLCRGRVENSDSTMKRVWFVVADSADRRGVGRRYSHRSCGLQRNPEVQRNTRTTQSEGIHPTHDLMPQEHHLCPSCQSLVSYLAFDLFSEMLQALRRTLNL
jgi:hypothetical protein